MILASVIVPYYNLPEYLPRLMRELAKQTYPHDRTEVVVVDDGSVQPASAVLSEAKSMPSDFRRVVILRHPANRGRASARNSGIRASVGQILIFIDADDYPAPDYVENVVGRHLNHPHIALRANMRIRPEMRSSSAFLRYRDSRFLGARPASSLRGVDLDDLPPRLFATSGSSLERSDLLAAGAFDEDFKGYGGEDEELGFRLRGRGIRIVFAKDAIIWDADSSLTLENVCGKYAQFGESGGALLFSKCPGYRSAFRYLEPLSPGAENALTAAKKLLLRSVIRPSVARLLRCFLTSVDHNPLPWDPPPACYKYVLTASYLEGVNRRTRTK